MDTKQNQAFIVVSDWNDKLCKVQIFDAQDPTIPPVAIATGEGESLTMAASSAFAQLTFSTLEGEGESGQATSAGSAE